MPRLEGENPIESFWEIFGRDRPWKKKILLALDGGEVLALCSLFVLQVFMKEIEERELSKNPEVRSSTYPPFIDWFIEQGLDSLGRFRLDDDLLQKKSQAHRPFHYFD